MLSNNTSESKPSSSEQRPNWKLWTIIGLVVIVLTIGAMWTIQKNKTDYALKTIACLQDQNIVVYINGSSPRWIIQQGAFNSLIPQDMIVDCSLSPESQQACTEKGLTFFPSWMKNKQVIRGVYTPKQLSKKATCPT